MVEPRGRPWGLQTLAGQGQLRNKTYFLTFRSLEAQEGIGSVNIYFCYLYCGETRVWAC